MEDLCKSEIICEKYNQSLEQKYQNEDHYKCSIQVSKNGNNLIVWNHKPNGYKIIAQEAEDTQEESAEVSQEKKELQLNEQYEYKKTKSSASCNLLKIKGFQFGGFSSRFWLLRKHINSMHMKDL